MLMELKKDYKHVIVQQTIKSAIGMKGSDEVAGLVSPKAKRSVTMSRVSGTSERQTTKDALV